MRGIPVASLSRCCGHQCQSLNRGTRAAAPSTVAARAILGYSWRTSPKGDDSTTRIGLVEAWGDSRATRIHLNRVDIVDRYCEINSSEGVELHRRAVKVVRDLTLLTIEARRGSFGCDHIPALVRND